MNVRVLVNAACALVALSLPLSAAVGSSGCGQTACLQWSATKGACPSQTEVRALLGDCIDITSIDGEATQADNLCCYPVSKTSNGINCVDFGSSGEGPVPPPDFASSSTGPLPFCDNTGFCGDTFSGCAGCAMKSACSAFFDACVQVTDCDELRTCIDLCPFGDFECKSTCLAEHPSGQAAYGAYATCVFCDNCPSDCSPNTDLCSFQSETATSVGVGGMSGTGGMSGVGGAGGMMSGTGGAGGKMSGTGGAGGTMSGTGGAGGMMSGTGGAGGKGG